MKKIVFCDCHFVSIKFHGIFFIKTSLFSLFVTIKMMLQNITNQNNILLNYQIINICNNFTS